MCSEEKQAFSRISLTRARQRKYYQVPILCGSPKQDYFISTKCSDCTGKNQAFATIQIYAYNLETKATQNSIK